MLRTYLFDQMWAREDVRGWKVITLVWQISLASDLAISRCVLFELAHIKMT